MSALSFNSQVLVTAQVQIITRKTKARLTKCENYGFSAILKPDVAQYEQEAWLNTLAVSRYAAEFLKRMKENPSLKHEIGGVEWEVSVLDLNYE